MNIRGEGLVVTDVTQNLKVMKTIAIAIAAFAMTFGAATQAEARDYRDSYRTTIVITGRDHRGNPIYAERYFIRMNAHGRPMWGYRAVRGRGYDRDDRGYDRGRDYRDYDRRDHDHRDPRDRYEGRRGRR